MPILNYWTQFEHTGSVEDYLCYVSMQKTERADMLAEAERSADGTAEGERIAACLEKCQAGVNPYAGIYMGNRNDIEADPCGGI